MSQFTPGTRGATFTLTGAADLRGRRMEQLVRNIKKNLRVVLNISPYYRTPRHFRYIRAARAILRNREAMSPSEPDQPQHNRRAV